MSSDAGRQVYCLFYDDDELLRCMTAAKRVSCDNEFLVLSRDDSENMRLVASDQLNPRSCFLLGDHCRRSLLLPLINLLCSANPSIPSLLFTTSTELHEYRLGFRSKIRLARPFDESMLENRLRRVFDMADQRANLIFKSEYIGDLSRRQTQIVEFATNGIPNKTIAKRLNISIRTVEKERRTAYKKLTVTSTAELASLMTFYNFVHSPSRDCLSKNHDD